MTVVNFDHDSDIPLNNKNTTKAESNVKGRNLSLLLYKLSSTKQKERYEALESLSWSFEVVNPDNSQLSLNLDEKDPHNNNDFFKHFKKNIKSTTASDDLKMSKKDALKLLGLILEVLCMEQHAYFDKMNKNTVQRDTTSMLYKKVMTIVQNAKCVMEGCIICSTERINVSDIDPLLNHLTLFFVDNDKNSLNTPFTTTYLKTINWIFCSVPGFYCITSEQWHSYMQIVLLAFDSPMLKLLSENYTRRCQLFFLQEHRSEASINVDESQALLLSLHLEKVIPAENFANCSLNLVLFYIEFLLTHVHESTFHAKILHNMNSLLLKQFLYSPELTLSVMPFIKSSIEKLWHTKNILMWNEILCFYHIYLNFFTQLNSKRVSEEVNLACEFLFIEIIQDIKKPRNFSRLPTICSSYDILEFMKKSFNNGCHYLLLHRLDIPSHYVLFITLLAKISDHDYDQFIKEIVSLLLYNDKNMYKGILIDVIIILSFYSPKFFDLFIERNLNLLLDLFFSSYESPMSFSLMVLLSVVVESTKLLPLLDPGNIENIWIAAMNKLRLNESIDCIFKLLHSLIMKGCLPSLAVKKRITPEFYSFLLSKNLKSMQSIGFLISFFMSQNTTSICDSNLNRIEDIIEDWIINMCSKAKESLSISNFLDLVYEFGYQGIKPLKEKFAENSLNNRTKTLWEYKDIYHLNFHDHSMISEMDNYCVNKDLNIYKMMSSISSFEVNGIKEELFITFICIHLSRYLDLPCLKDQSKTVISLLDSVVKKIADLDTFLLNFDFIYIVFTILFKVNYPESKYELKHMLHCILSGLDSQLLLQTLIELFESLVSYDKTSIVNFKMDFSLHQMIPWMMDLMLTIKNNIIDSAIYSPSLKLFLDDLNLYICHYAFETKNSRNDTFKAFFSNSTDQVEVSLGFLDKFIHWDFKNISKDTNHFFHVAMNITLCAHMLLTKTTPIRKNISLYIQKMTSILFEYFECFYHKKIMIPWIKLLFSYYKLEQDKLQEHGKCFIELVAFIFSKCSSWFEALHSLIFANDEFYFLSRKFEVDYVSTFIKSLTRSAMSSDLIVCHALCLLGLISAGNENLSEVLYSLLILLKEEHPPSDWKKSIMSHYFEMSSKSIGFKDPTSFKAYLMPYLLNVWISHKKDLGTFPFTYFHDNVELESFLIANKTTIIPSILYYTESKDEFMLFVLKFYSCFEPVKLLSESMSTIIPFILPSYFSKNTSRADLVLYDICRSVLGQEKFDVLFIKEIDQIMINLIRLISFESYFDLDTELVNTVIKSNPNDVLLRNSFDLHQQLAATQVHNMKSIQMKFDYIQYPAKIIYTTLEHISKLLGNNISRLSDLIYSNTRSFKILFSLMKDFENTPIVYFKLAALYQLKLFVLIWSKSITSALVVIVLSNWLLHQINYTDSEWNSYVVFLWKFIVQRYCKAVILKDNDVGFYILPTFMDKLLQGLVSIELFEETMDVFISTTYKKNLYCFFKDLMLSKLGIIRLEPNPDYLIIIKRDVYYEPLKKKLLKYYSEALIFVNVPSNGINTSMIYAHHNNDSSNSHMSVNTFMDTWSIFYYNLANNKLDAHDSCLFSNLFERFYGQFINLLETADTELKEVTVTCFKDISSIMTHSLLEIYKDQPWFKDLKLIFKMFGDVPRKFVFSKSYQNFLKNISDVRDVHELTMDMNEWGFQLYIHLLNAYVDNIMSLEKEDSAIVHFSSHFAPIMSRRKDLILGFLPYLFYHTVVLPSLSSHAHCFNAVFGFLNESIRVNGLKKEIFIVVLECIFYSYQQFREIHFNDKKSILHFYTLLDVDYSSFMKCALKNDDTVVALYFYQIIKEIHPTQLDPSILYDIYLSLEDKDAFNELAVSDWNTLVNQWAHDNDYECLFSYYISLGKLSSPLMNNNKGLFQCYDHLGYSSLLLNENNNIDAKLFQEHYIKAAWKTRQWNIHLAKVEESDKSWTTCSNIDLVFHSKLFDVLKTLATKKLDKSNADTLINSFIKMYLSFTKMNIRDENLVLLNELYSLLLVEDSAVKYKNWKARKNDVIKNEMSDQLLDFLSLSGTVSEIGYKTRGSSYLKAIFFDSMLESTKFYRKNGNLQLAFNSLSMIKDDLKSTEPQYSQLLLEESKCLYAKGKHGVAIQWLKQHLTEIESQKSLDENGILIQTKYYITLAKWVLEIKCESSSTILTDYYEKALSSVLSYQQHGFNFAQSKLHYKLGKFSDAQYQIKCSSSSDLELKFSLLAHKYEELKKYEDMISTAPSDKHKLHYERIAHSLKQQIELDKKDYDMIITEANVYLIKAIENYIYALKFDTNSEQSNIYAIFRLVSLWLGHLEYVHINDMLVQELDHIPTYHFIPLMYQLVSRLDSDSSIQFQSLLKRLVQKIILDHPFHTVYQLFALKNAVDCSFNGTESCNKKRKHGSIGAQEGFLQGKNKDRVEYRRAIASEAIIYYIRASSSRMKDIIDSVDLICNAYIELAHREVKSTSETIVKLDPKMIIYQIQNMTSIPVITSYFKIDKSCKYPSGSFIGIDKFDSHFSLVGGMNLPKVIECYGLDGLKYKQLVKSKDDLRTDAVMTQIFSLVNNIIMTSKKNTSKENCRNATHLLLRTYKVIPLQPLAGVLEWVKHTVPIGDWLTKNHERIHPKDKSPNEVRNIMNKEHQSNQSTPASKLAVYTQSILPFFKTTFRHFFYETYYKSPRDWFLHRLAYIKSYAVSCIVGYIVGLGDRHCQNILIDILTGEILQIDLNLIFDAGKLLRVPERVPFRLTREMVDPMMISSETTTGQMNGTFSKTCERILEFLRLESDLILTLLDVFKYDPMHKWNLVASNIISDSFTKKENVLKTAMMAAYKQQQEEYDDTLMEDFMNIKNGSSNKPSTSNNAFNTTFSNVSLPLSILSKTCESNENRYYEKVHPEAERALLRVKEKLHGFEESSQLSVHGQVNYLIRQAMNPENLCQMYPGWQPWM